MASADDSNSLRGEYVYPSLYSMGFPN